MREPSNDMNAGSTDNQHLHRWRRGRPTRRRATHKLPVASAIRKAIGKTDGDDVLIHLERRLS